MYIFKTVVALQQYISEEKAKGKTIGYVPTMGALHQGHLQLLLESQKENPISVCSIFVNPTQFEDKKDLEKYPKPIETDIDKLETINCTVLFLPNAEEIYPPDLVTPSFDLNNLDKTMEGAKRDGHFAGVVQVVHRLLDIVKPNSLYMGQKDYQQFAVIKHMLHLMASPIRLVRVAIVREADGLAMSSRNVRLSPEGRQKAGHISKALFQAQINAQSMPLEAVKELAIENLKKENLEIDYLEIVNGNSLQEIQTFAEAPVVTLCTVVKVDGVRLLDNIILKEA